MENNTMARVYKFYNELREEDKQTCDMCIDYGLTHCDDCEIAEEHVETTEQEE